MVEEVAAAVEKERSLISDADRRSRDCSSRADAVAKVWRMVLYPGMGVCSQSIRWLHERALVLTTAAGSQKAGHIII